MKQNKFYFGLGIFIVFGLWQIITTFNLVDSFFLPAPLEVFTELANLIISGAIIPDALATIWRVLIAFIIALIIGVPTGLLLGNSKKIYESLEVVIDFSRSLPPVAIFPLFLLILGIGDVSKIGVAAFGAAFIILFNTAHGVKHSNKQRIRAAKLMGATKIQIFTKISFWESLPQTFAGLRVSLSLVLIVIITTEMFIGTQFGLGRRIVDFQYIYNIIGMYAVILLTGIIGYGLNHIFNLVEKRIIHWSGR